MIPNSFKIINIVFIGLMIISALTYFQNKQIEEQKSEVAKKAYALIKNCKLIEANHFNGYFTENTNKLDCNGVIYNVDTSLYNESMGIE